MDSEYSVKITADAFTDLDKIFDYISNELASPLTAKKFRAEFSEKVKILSDNPLIGTFVLDEEMKSVGYRKISIKNYVAVYSVDDKNKVVYILRIFYSKSNYRKYL